MGATSGSACGTFTSRNSGNAYHFSSAIWITSRFKWHVLHGVLRRGVAPQVAQPQLRTSETSHFEKQTRIAFPNLENKQTLVNFEMLFPVQVQ